MSSHEVDSKPVEMTCPRLSMPQLAIVVVVCAIVLGLLPACWNRIEPFDPDENYRIPYELSRDYGHVERFVRHAAQEKAVLLLGDSAIWGEYVLPNETLSAALNRSSAHRFSNIGVNGMHPLALEGLSRLHLSTIPKTRVLLHCNLLWLSSPERDLTAEEAQSFNHRQLVSQFRRRIPSYSTTLADRLGTVFQRQLPFRETVFHVRTTYFEGNDLHRWTLQNPYGNPLMQIGNLPQPSSKLRHEPKSWLDSHIPIQEYRWVDLNESLQWKATQSTVMTLSKSGHRVVVLVGPFNVHLLSEANAKVYRKLRTAACRWFGENEILFVAPDWLRSEFYADASHPLADGYATLAEQLLQNQVFSEWLSAIP